MSRYIRPQPIAPSDDLRTPVTQYALAGLIIVAGFVLIGRTPIGGFDWLTWVGFVLLVSGGVWFGALWSQPSVTIPSEPESAGQQARRRIKGEQL